MAEAHQRALLDLPNPFPGQFQPFTNLFQRIRPFVIYPEIVICITAALVLLVDLILPDRHKWVLAAISFLGVIVAMQLVFRNFSIPGSAFFGMIVNDSAGSYFKTIFCLGTMLTIFLSVTYQRREFPRTGEFYTLIPKGVTRLILESHRSK